MDIPAGTYFQATTPASPTSPFVIPLLDGNGKVLIVPVGKRPVLLTASMTATRGTGTTMSIAMDTTGDGTHLQNLLVLTTPTTKGRVISGPLYGAPIGFNPLASPFNNLRNYNTLMLVRAGGGTAVITITGVILDS